MSREEIERIFKAVGEAALALNMQNTHSGNMCVLEMCDEQKCDLYVTRHGAQLGNLETGDIVNAGFYESRDEKVGASMETKVHREILRKTGGSSMHTHIWAATLISYGAVKIRPIDAYGAHILGETPVLSFDFHVDNPEIVRKLPETLEKHPALMVEKHGCFTRGKTLKEAFYHAALLEFSSRILLDCKTLGVDTDTGADGIYADLKGFFHEPPAWSEDNDTHLEIEDQRAVYEFTRTGRDIYYMELSPFHTGSMSIRMGKNMLFAPKASRPRRLDGPILCVPIEPRPDDSPELIIHKRVYAKTEKRAVIHTLSPRAQAQAWHAFSEGRDHIKPIDVEGEYLYPSIPVVNPKPDPAELSEIIDEKKMAVIRGEGIWAADETLGLAIHHVSSAKNIAFYRTGLHGMDAGEKKRT